MNKILLGKNVRVAARERIEWVFDTFERVCVAFSGGKDSTVLMHLVAETARKIQRPFTVLFVDWEVQFNSTIEHITAIKNEYADIIESFYWVALPLTTVSGVSQYQPEWVCWDPESEWVRHPPEDAITEPAFFPFYYPCMTFEEFIPGFTHWLTSKTPDLVSVTLVGVRADESLNRMRALMSRRKQRYAEDLPWTTVQPVGSGYTAWPLYDWKVQDIWSFSAQECKRINPLYNLMYQAGVSLTNMRICEPFGPEQRRGLWLYHVLEPETWTKVCQRVSGASSGSRYGNRSGGYFALRTPLVCPPHLNWEDYACFLLDSMPPGTAEHYRNKIAIYLKWYYDREFPYGIPQQQDKDMGARDIPSWRRICKVLIKNDYWCKMLSFSPNKPRHYARYLARTKQKREVWGIF